MNITVYCGSHPSTHEHFIQAAEEFGRWIGKNGHCLVYGGSAVGLMGIISKNVLEAGGTAIGVETRFFLDAGVRQHEITEMYVVDTMAERKTKMLELGDIFVALPGGIGTLEELSEVMSRVRLNLSPRPFLLLNLDGFYEPLNDLVKTMEQAGFIPELNPNDFLFPKSVKELTDILSHIDPSDLTYSNEYHWEEPEWLSEQEYG